MTSPVTPEMSAKIASWRMRSQDGTLSVEEMKEAIIYLRAGRLAAASSASASKSRAAKKPSVAAPSADSLLGDLADM